MHHEFGPLCPPPPPPNPTPLHQKLYKQQSLPKLNTLDLSLVHISVSDHLGNKPIIIIIIIYEEPTKERNSTRYLRTT